MKSTKRKRYSARWRTLIQTLQHSKPVEAFEAAKNLGCLNRKESIPHLIEVMRSAQSAQNREAAAYALTCMSRKELTPEFANCVADATQSDTVRGQAAEGLACLGWYLRPTSRLYRQAEKVLLANLNSSSQVVRFWCSFALGSMRSKRAIRKLTAIRRNDHAICPGWWKVSEEAADALVCIRTGYWPEHPRGKAS